MHVFILAGGFATRLWPLTERRSKPLLPLCGKPLITHLVDGLPRELPVTVSTNDTFAEAFRAWVEGLDRGVDLVIERTQSDAHKLGALGAIAAWVREAKIDDDLLVLTGDNYLGFKLGDFLARYTGHPLVAAHDIGDLGRASSFGTVIVDAKDPTLVSGFEEKPKDPRTTLVSAGCVVLPRASLPILLEHARTHPDNLGGIFEELLRRKVRVECFAFREPWIDIGSFQSYLEAHRTLMGDRVLLGKDALLADSETEGSVTVGAGSIVERSTLRDSMVFDHCVIRDCTLRNCVIDDGCVLRGVDLQNQMIRAGTKIELP